jgi:hypothetical protein
VRLIAGIAIIVCGALLAGCGSNRVSRETKCYEWLSKIASGEVAIDSVQSKILGDDPQLLEEDQISDICSLGQDWKLIAPHGVIPAGGLALIMPCINEEQGCGLPAFSQNLIADKRFRSLDATDRYVLMVAATKFTRSYGDIDPLAFRTPTLAELEQDLKRINSCSPPRRGKRCYTNPNRAFSEWGRVAGVPVNSVRVAVRAGLRSGLVTAKRLFPEELCDPFKRELDSPLHSCLLAFDPELLPRLPRYGR